MKGWPRSNTGDEKVRLVRPCYYFSDLTLALRISTQKAEKRRTGDICREVGSQVE